MPRLRRSDCAGPGLARVKRGRGFGYTDESGRTVTDEATLARIRALAIPPAWKDVWICSDELGHLQATGVDAAGRKQYRYHDLWRTRRDRRKFDDMLEFAAALPALRRGVSRDLNRTELDRRRVLACAIRLLDLGFFRIGSEDYAAEYETFGLTTMQRRHVTVTSDEVIFDYRAKDSKRRVQSIADPHVRDIVAALKRRRGGPDDLLVYRDGRRWADLDAGDVNAELKRRCGPGVSAKDFRTWNATVLAAIALGAADIARSPTARKRTISAVMGTVAVYLGNTAAVARASYVDPRVLDRYRSGWTIAPLVARHADGPDLGRPKVRREIEAAVLDLLTDRNSDAVTRV
jgi:DNA topoisomerase IB